MLFVLVLFNQLPYELISFLNVFLASVVITFIGKMYASQRTVFIEKMRGKFMGHIAYLFLCLFIASRPFSIFSFRVFRQYFNMPFAFTSNSKKII